MKLPNLPIPSFQEFLVIDSTKLSDFSKCQRLFFFKHLLGLQPEGKPQALAYGVAIHLALEHLMNEGMTRETLKEAYSQFIESYRGQGFEQHTDETFAGKSPRNTLFALVQYANLYKLDGLETLYTEVGGSVPIADGRAIHFRMDSVVRDRDGLIWSLDHKTSASLHGWWTAQWSLRYQIGTYIHAINCLYSFNQIGGAIINGLFLKKPKANGEICNDFLRVPIRKTGVQMENWLVSVNRRFDSLEQELELLSNETADAGVMASFPQTPESCVQYNRLCPFHTICTAWTNPLQRCEEVPMGYKREFWNPNEEDVKVEIDENGIKEKE